MHKQHLILCTAAASRTSDFTNCIAIKICYKSGVYYALNNYFLKAKRITALFCFHTGNCLPEISNAIPRIKYMK